MITRIATQAVYVTDQAEAERFWTQKVGFMVAERRDMGNGSAWLEVGPIGAETNLVLYPRDLMQGWEQKQSSIVFASDDIEADYARLAANGVEVGDPPKRMAWGSFATFKDPDGNVFLLKG
jgi:lactoylglutathione lyase